MSKLKQSSGEDYPEAAKKMCLDARVLLDNDRFAGAAYLAGYVTECILKTLIQVEKKDSEPIKTHNLDGLSSNAIKLMAHPNSRTARYFKYGQITGIAYDTNKPPTGRRNSKEPPILTFYSFKGGVGRTTALAAFAVQRARNKITYLSRMSLR